MITINIQCHLDFGRVNCATSKGLVQRGPSPQSQGLAASLLGNSTGWWADTRLSFCISKEQTLIRTHYKTLRLS